MALQPTQRRRRDRGAVHEQSSPTTHSSMRPRRVVVRNERLATRDWGEAYLMWRCGVCGEMGDLEAFPLACPDCAAPREELAYWIED
ncbi:DUF7130 family rubredoxin-like protein [Haloferacaceae archaeon DSL9]